MPDQHQFMTSNTKPLVSVIIPIHNRSEDLNRSVPSILAQTEQSFEILIIDDASTEDLSIVVNNFNDPRIKLIRNDKKGNAGTVRNTGIDLACGEYIAFLDSDDEWFPDHLKSKIEYINSHSCDGTFGSVFVFDGTSDRYVQSKPIRPKQHAADYSISGGSNPPSSWVMKSSAAKEIKFDSSLVIHEDFDYFVRFHAKFKWAAMWQPTTRMYWISGVARLKHPYSQILYMQRYINDIQPRSYFTYSMSLLGSAIKAEAQPEIIKYYRSECLRYPDIMSFTDFSSVLDKSMINRIFVFRLTHFALLIFWRKISKKSAPKLKG